MLADDLRDPSRCLLPVAEWPSETPHSRVYATDAEWYSICKAAAARGMFVPVDVADIFRNQFGDLVLNGAMGVDKYKDSEHQLRFISILTPLNAYMRKLCGDSWLLPQASVLSSLFLDLDEQLVISSEDLKSCFNLFYLPEAWRGYVAFSQTGPSLRIWSTKHMDLCRH